jgi:hypothetical protein
MENSYKNRYLIKKILLYNRSWPYRYYRQQILRYRFYKEFIEQPDYKRLENLVNTKINKVRQMLKVRQNYKQVLTSNKQPTNISTYSITQLVLRGWILSKIILYHLYNSSL